MDSTQLKKTHLYSGNDTIKGYDSATGSISIPSQSYTAGQYRSFSTDIPLEEAVALTQVYSNWSTDSTKWYAGSFLVISLNANFQGQLRSSFSGTTMTATFYVINQTGGTVSSPDFTVTILVRRFIAPFA